LPDHDVRRTVNWLINIEEARRFTNLLHLGVSEGSLNDDVDQLLSSRVRLIAERILQVKRGVSIDLDHDVVGCAVERGGELCVFLKLRHQVDHFTRADVEAKGGVHLLAFRAKDLNDHGSIVELKAEDVNAILVHRDVCTQRQLVLVGDDLYALQVLVHRHKSRRVRLTHCFFVDVRRKLGHLVRLFGSGTHRSGVRARLAESVRPVVLLLLAVVEEVI